MSLELNCFDEDFDINQEKRLTKKWLKTLIKTDHL